MRHNKLSKTISRRPAQLVRIDPETCTTSLEEPAIIGINKRFERLAQRIASSYQAGTRWGSVHIVAINEASP